METVADKTGVFQEGKKFVAYNNGEIVTSAYNHRQAEIALEKAMGIYVDGRSKKSKNEKKYGSLSQREQKFHVNKRFEFLEKAVQMVADGVQPSVIISGRGGVGKSYSVTKTLKDFGLMDMSMSEDMMGIDNPEDCFITLKGYSTAKSLYRTLYENNGSVIICDDMDSVFKDNTSISILKAALDSYSNRVIHWGAEMRGDDNLPRTFEFTGRIIFITNLNSDEIDQAVVTRSMVIDLAMSPSELIDRMMEIIKSRKFLPEYSMEVKFDSINFIDKMKDEVKELSLRTLISVCKIRYEFPKEWEEMAAYIICK